MRVIIALAVLVVSGVSSEKKILRIAVWNVEKYNNATSNITKVLGNATEFDVIFLSIQGIKEFGVFDKWLDVVKRAVSKENLELYHWFHYGKLSHIMGCKKQYKNNFSPSRKIDYYRFHDNKLTTMISLDFAWHKQNFSIIHGLVPKTINKTLQSKYYKTFHDTLVKRGTTDFFFIAGKLTYLAKLLHEERGWRFGGSGKDYSENEVIFKTTRYAELLSFDILTDFKAPQPFWANFEIDIDTS